MGRRAFISFPLRDHESARLMEKLAEEAGGDYLTSYLGGPHGGHMTVDFDTAHDDGAVLDQVEAALTAAKRAFIRFGLGERQTTAQVVTDAGICIRVGSNRGVTELHKRNSLRCHRRLSHQLSRWRPNVDQ